MTGTEPGPPPSGQADNGEEVLGGPADGSESPEHPTGTQPPSSGAAEQARQQAEQIARHRTSTDSGASTPRKEGQRNAEDVRTEAE